MGNTGWTSFSETAWWAFGRLERGPGDPSTSFYLTEHGHESLPKGYDQLLGMIVQELSALTSEDTIGKGGQQILELVFLRLSSGVAQAYKDELDGQSLSRRLAALMGRLGQENFYPEADVANGKLMIRLLNCPFRSVALQNKSVCTFDLELISSLLEVDVEREECIHDGDGGCMYTAIVGDKAERELLPLGAPAGPSPA